MVGPEDSRMQAAATSSTASPEPARAPRWWLLPFRPGRVLSRRAPSLGAAATFLLAWTVGVADSIGGVELLASARDTPPGWMGSWPAYWSLCVGRGLVAGGAAWLLGGAFFVLRLWLAGAREIDWSVARRVYLGARLIGAVPAIALLGVETAAWPTPTAAAWSSQTWMLALDGIVLAMVVWSIVAAWRGAVATFVVGPWRAALLFLALPLAFVAVLVTAVAALTLFSAADAPAAVASPQEHADDAFTFSAPGNWFVDVDRDAESGWHAVHVEAPQDAIVSLMSYESGQGPDGELEATRTELRESGFSWTDEEPLTRWGPLEGQGTSFTALVDGLPYRVRVVVAPLTARHVVEVREMSLEAALANVGPGFDLVRSTLDVHPPEAAPPAVDAPKPFTYGFLSFEHPGNWTVAIDPEATVVHPALEISGARDFLVQVLVYPRVGSIDEEIDVTLEDFAADWGPPRLDERVDAWAGLDGGGVRVVMTDEGGRETSLFAFVAPITGSRMLEVRAHAHPADEAAVAEGLALIARTLRTGTPRTDELAAPD